MNSSTYYRLINNTTLEETVHDSRADAIKAAKAEIRAMSVFDPEADSTVFQIIRVTETTTEWFEM